jgi:hypothetical protein
LARDASAATTTVASRPRSPAARASAKPWFPAEAVTIGPSGAAAIAARAPRILKDPVGCKVSTFSHACWPRSEAATTGVAASVVFTTFAAAASCSLVGGRTARVLTSGTLTARLTSRLALGEG